jgi:hypothetical protein
MKTKNSYKTDRSIVECSQHGEGQAAYICQHLMQGKGAGFNTAGTPDEADELCPAAWCDDCEEVLNNEGEWTELAQDFATISLVCGHCYFAARRLHWPSGTHILTDRLIERAVAYLEPKQERLTKIYRLAGHGRYDWNQGTGQLVFSNGGVPSVIAEIQFVGSVSPVSGTWMWSWANRSFDEVVREQVRRVRAHGAKRRMMKLACPVWEATEEDGWEMTAVTAFLLRAEGAYRTESRGGQTFMVMTSVRWAQ